MAGMVNPLTFAQWQAARGLGGLGQQVAVPSLNGGTVASQAAAQAAQIPFPTSAPSLTQPGAFTMGPLEAGTDIAPTMYSYPAVMQAARAAIPMPAAGAGTTTLGALAPGEASSVMAGYPAIGQAAAQGAAAQALAAGGAEGAIAGPLSAEGLGTAAEAGAAAGTAGKLAGLFAEGGRLAPGTLGGAGVYAGGGLLAGGLLRKAVGNQDGTADDAAVDAVKGAGIGAGIASIVPGVGTLLGAGIGAAAGGLYGWLKGGQSDATAAAKVADEQRTKLTDLMGQYNVSPTLSKQVMMQYDIGLANATNKAQVKAVGAQLLGALPGAIISDQQQQARSTDVAAVSAWLAPMMQQQLTKSDLYSQQWSNAASAAADAIQNRGLRTAYQAAAKQIPLDTATQNALMLQQLALQPSLYGYQSNGATSAAAQQSLAGITSTTPTAATNPFASPVAATGQ